VDGSVRQSLKCGNDRVPGLPSGTTFGDYLRGLPSIITPVTFGALHYGATKRA
jgi:hypothetical protein